MRFSELEQSISKPSRVLRLDSIRSRILFFAVFATLVPSIITAWIAYSRLKESVNDKVAQEVVGASKQSAHAVGLWLKERLVDLRTFATSYEVTENLELTARRGAAGPSQRRLNDYLNSVRERFGEYVELMVVDPQGRVIATSARQIRQVQMPPHWTSDINLDEPSLGEPYRDDNLGTTLVVLAVPVHAQSGGRLLGALTAKISLGAVDQMFRQYAPADSGRIFLVTTDSSSTGSIVSG